MWQWSIIKKNLMLLCLIYAMIKRIAKLVIFVAIAYSLYLWYFLPLNYVDGENSCNIAIEQSFDYKQKDAKKSIELIKSSSPEYYEKMCRYAGTISSKFECNSQEGRVIGCAYGGNKIGLRPLSDSSIEELTSIIIHETCHFHQGHNRPADFYSGDLYGNLAKNEVECYSEQNKFLKKVGSSARFPNRN